jgi:surface antigen/LysM repeat protein
MGHVAFSQKSTTKRSKKELIKPIGLYASAFIMLVAVVAVGYQAPSDDIRANVSSSQASETAEVSPIDIAIDEKIATDVAANLALQTNMPVAANVASLSISLEADKEVARVDSGAIAKPQIVQAAADTRTIVTYKAKAGDTVQQVAEKFELTPQTIKWANNMASDAIEDGRDIVIPPVDGVVYVTKQGDTAQSIAETYKASADRIVAFNDLEEGIKPEVRIIIPDGELPEDQRPGYQRPRPVTPPAPAAAPQPARNSSFNASSGNAYAFGNCTWYAYERRAQLGRPIGSFWGDATSWASSGAAAGFAVNGSPAPGAIMQNHGGLGHVAIVESVGPDGSVTFSDMNGVAGFNRVGTKTVSAAEAARFNYIH